MAQEAEVGGEVGETAPASAGGGPLKDGGIAELENQMEQNASVFQELEKEFQEVLQQLMSDESLQRFRSEYEKLHRALRNSHEQEKRLVRKCRELNTEILNNQAKIKTALRLSQEDQKTIAHLQKELEKTWKLVYMAQEKEVRAKETVNQLKEEMANLSKLVERGAGLSVSQENQVKELRQAKEELSKQHEEQTSQIKLMEAQLQELHRQREDLRQEKDSQAGIISSLRENLQHRENEVTREQRRRERLQKEVHDMRVQMDAKHQREEQMQGEVTRTHSQIEELEKQLHDARATMERYLRDYDSLYDRTEKLTSDLEDQIANNRGLHAVNQNLEKDSKLQAAELARALTAKTQLERRVDREHRQVLRLKQSLEEASTPVLVAQAQIESLNKELDAMHKRESDMRKELETVDRARQQQQRATQRAEERTRDVSDQAEEQERIAFSLGSEISAYKDELVRQRKMIYQLEKERERLGNEASDQRHAYLQAIEDTKLRDMRVNELQKKVTEGEAKLKQQQQLYESVRADRNHYSKNLIEAQDEIAEMKRKFKIMDHQIEQLKEEIAAKDQALVKEHFDHQRVEKLREQTRLELSKKDALLKKNHEVVHQQEAEIRRLSTAMRRMDDEALTQRKEYDQVINERDILGTQLIRRNDELALLYEKLKIMQSTMRKGEAQYAARVQDVRKFKIKLRDVQREMTAVRSRGHQVDDLKRDVSNLQRQLLQEKTKVKALSEELENPMNVHRWRKLEGSDPAAYEMIQKIQTLQRRLIAKTEEVVEKEIVIQEKEKLYQELKGILARQPGPEVAEQLSVYQQSLRRKGQQMKAVASELNMFQAQVNEYKYEIERLNRELQDMKRRYYEQKRREKMLRDVMSDAGAPVVAPGALTADLMSTGGRSGPSAAPDAVSMGVSGPAAAGGAGGAANIPALAQGNGSSSTSMPPISQASSSVGYLSRSQPAQALQSQQQAASRAATLRFAGGGFAIK